MGPFVWIVNDKRTVQKLRRDDPWLTWDWPHTPKGHGTDE
jgi:hypothetical protein